MQTSYKDQINAIKAVMSNWTPDSNMYKALNDAASTIASLNLTKGLPKEEISDNDFEYLLELFESHIEASDPEEEKKAKERIFRFINTGESACEFCGGSGEFSRDNSDGVAIEGKCSFCEGTGVEKV